jgi:transcriptional regulator with XRE-family HTH domain
LSDWKIGWPRVQWIAEDWARHQAIRDVFRDRHPSPEELLATGEGASVEPHGEGRELRAFVAEIKPARQAAGFTLAEVSRRCGIDQPVLSRLEDGHNKNPTQDTLRRYAAAVGRRLVLTTEAIHDTRPTQAKAKRVRAARESQRLGSTFVAMSGNLAEGSVIGFNADGRTLRFNGRRAERLKRLLAVRLPGPESRFLALAPPTLESASFPSRACRSSGNSTAISSHLAL